MNDSHVACPILTGSQRHICAALHTRCGASRRSHRLRRDTSEIGWVTSTSAQSSTLTTIERVCDTAPQSGVSRARTAGRPAGSGCNRTRSRDPLPPVAIRCYPRIRETCCSTIAARLAMAMAFARSSPRSRWARSASARSFDLLASKTMSESVTACAFCNDF